MSMDTVYEYAQVLERELDAFNDGLRASFEEVMTAHGNVAPLWDDAMRRDYDVRWQPLEDVMRDYVQRVGPHHLEFLTERLHHLRTYLHGHGA